MNAKSIEAASLDDLTQDLMATGGKAVVSVIEAAELHGCSPQTVRRALWRGELTGSRSAMNGPIRIRLRELARWILAGEKRSLPVNRDLQRRAAKAGGAEA